MADKDVMKAQNPIKTALGMMSNFAGNVNPAFKTMGEYICWNESPIKIPEVNQLLQLYWQKKLSETEFIKYMKEYGYNENWIYLIQSAYKQYLSAQEYATLKMRGLLSQNDYQQKLKEMNMIDEQNNILNSLQYFPSVSDLVRFAVREVYTPKTEEKFGQLQEFPEIFGKEAAKAGLPLDQAKNYWSAHWELPSISLGYEMFHRTSLEKIDDDCDTITLPSGKTCYNVIGNKTLELLIKSQDVMPFWRDKLTSVSYNPLTRVDVRRMYALGAIDEDKVFRSYLDEGYSPENATAMTNFTVKEYSQESHQITREAILKAYKEDIITKEHCIDHLKQIKLKEDAIDFYITLADYDKHVASIKSLVTTLTDQFQSGHITIEEVRNKLTAEDMPTSFIETTLVKVQTHASVKRKLPTEAQLTAWLKKSIIEEKTYVTRMKSLGYVEEDIGYFLAELKGTIT